MRRPRPTQDTRADDNNDDDVTDLKVMKIKQWIEKTKDREQWRLVVEEAKAHPGL